MTNPLNIGKRLRNLLLTTQGMTVRELSKADGTPMDTIMAALERNYGFYVGGWEKAVAGKYRAKWYCVPVPQSAPKPMEYATCFDTEESISQRKQADYKAMQARNREVQARARKQYQAKREAEKLADKARKAELRAARLKAKEDARAARAAKKLGAPAGGDNYVPQKTVWVTPPPWAQGAKA